MEEINLLAPLVFLAFCLQLAYLLYLCKQISMTRAYWWHVLIHPLVPLLLYGLKLMWVRVRQSRKARAERLNLMKELPIFIESLQCCLEAGIPLSDALEHLGGRRWCRAIAESLSVAQQGKQVGIALHELLKRIAEEHRDKPDSRHLATLFRALYIAHRGGGPLAPLLKSLRQQCQRKFELYNRVQMLSAPMRAQARLISATPLVIAMFMGIVAPTRLLFFVQDGFGWMLSGAVIVLTLLGNRCMARLGKVT